MKIGSREADQRLRFRYTDSTIPLLPESEISSLLLSSVSVQPGLCRIWSETPKTGFLTTRLILLLKSGRKQIHFIVIFREFFVAVTPLNVYRKSCCLYPARCWPLAKFVIVLFREFTIYTLSFTNIGPSLVYR